MNGLHYSKAQRVRVAERDRLSVEIRNGWHLYDMMCKCGSKEDADANLKPKINKMVLERERLERSIHDESRKGTSALLMTLCACDLLTELADVFGYTLTEISRGAEPANNAFTEECKRLASEFNNLVCKIDTGGNSALSMFYADMAEEATAEARKAMQSVIDKWANTKKGSEYF